MNFLRALRRPHLAVVWLSQALSALGDQLYGIAVVWIAVQLNGSAAGLVVAAQSGSALLFGLLGGVYADRWNRRVTMMSADLLRGLAALSLPLLVALHALSLGYLIGVAIVLGALDALFDPALQASLPALTEDASALQAANGLMDMTQRLARALGPGAAGALVAILPLPHFFTLDAVSFGVSALAIFSLGRRFVWRPRRIEASAAVGAGPAGVAREIGEAARLVQRNTPLAWALVANGVINALWAIAFTVGAALFARRALAGDIGAYGLIVGAYGAGNILSNLVIGSVTIRRPVALIFAGKVTLGVGFMALAIAPTLPLAMLGAALAAVGGPMGDIPMLTMMQTQLPQESLGKVFSLRMTLAYAGALAGELIAVPLFDAAPVRLVIALAACGMVGIGVVGLLRFGVRPEQVIAAPARRRS